MAADPVITSVQDAVASSMLSLQGRSLELRRTLAFLLPFQEVGSACRSHHKYLLSSNWVPRPVTPSQGQGPALHKHTPPAHTPAQGDVPESHADPRWGSPLPPGSKFIGSPREAPHALFAHLEEHLGESLPRAPRGARTHSQFLCFIGFGFALCRVAGACTNSSRSVFID